MLYDQSSSEPRSEPRKSVTKSCRMLASEKRLWNREDGFEESYSKREPGGSLVCIWPLVAKPSLSGS